MSFFVINCYGQLSSPTQDFSTLISYPTAPGADEIFVFYSTGTIDKKGSLLATPFIPGSYNFSWSKYNPQISGFDLPFLNETNVSQSNADNLIDGGYKVRLWNGGFDTTIMAWVLIDNFNLNVLKNAEGKVLSSKYTCDYIILNGEIDSVNYTFYDTITNVSVSLPTGYSFLWTSDNTDLIIPWPDTSLVSNRSYKPPYKDTWYYLTSTDKLGMTIKDSVLYESIVAKADFSFLVYDKVEAKDFITPPSPAEGDAPFKVKFINESINGASYEWVFSDKIRSNEITQDLLYQPEFSYNIPDDYYPAIIVTTEEGCIDSVRITDPITVKPSLLEVMNVFSPDGDSFNDYFIVSHQSIREFTIRIFNRNGRTVYKAEIKNLHDWKGWDGNVLNTDKPASPGAYYYVIESIGWDDKKYRKGQFAGVVYLFREDN